ncbi:MAG TPA: hypothetical protein VH105_26115 [Burkholderiales bacterium]|nr:hypothetical protein [Burkholderiales bacterium]
MKTLHILSASLILAAASSAFAGTDDGNVPGAYVLQTPRQVSAPVATTTQDTGTAASAKMADTDFLRQQRAVSGN